MKDDKIILTKEQAIGLLSDDDHIHTFRSGSMIMIGADWRRSELVEAINTNICEIGGDQCKRMGHGLVVHTGGLLFVEVDKNKLEKLETELSK